MTEPLVLEPDLEIYCGDARAVLAGLPAGSVHAVLTSPPFFGLRDYGTGRWEGGDPDCDHARPTTSMNQSFNERWGQGGGEKRQERKSNGQYGRSCPKCGAERVDEQIGLEETPEEWAAAIVDVCREARRVLRDDGTLWLEVGDAYNAGRNGGHPGGKATDVQQVDERYQNRSGANVAGCKPKDLIGAPWLLAFALRADGWYLRGEYVWEKPDAMPESVRDRCTTAHSRVFHFSRSYRYYFDQDAIREPLAEYPRGAGAGPLPELDLAGEPAVHERRGPDGRRALRVQAQQGSHQHRDGERWADLDGRSPRSVWRITTEASSFGLCPACRTYWPERAPREHCGVEVVAHFAVWPHELAGRIIACSTSEAGSCGDCGAPLERTRQASREVDAGGSSRKHAAVRERQGPTGALATDKFTVYETSGWEPTCSCGAEPVPCTVLDPFAGSATTGRQARAMGRRAVLIELSPEYAEISVHRTAQQSLLSTA